MRWATLSLLFLLACATLTMAADGHGNRLADLDQNNPYFPHTGFPKLTTPQWIGEEGIEAVVILAIDDMRDPDRYEAYLRPILQRLKKIDDRAPVSIMTNRVDPQHPLLRQWLVEGLSIECHTLDHPCPLLQGGDFQKASATYHGCVDLLHEIPGNKPVAFRMPCCDSLNTASSRFYAEIFNKTTEQGRFLQIDSSVFNLFTADDPEIPRALILDADGGERFRPYLPRNLRRGGATFDTFVNYIQNYPYPYVMNGLCWQFPCAVPSDWSAQHRHGVNNPQTVEDWKAALDITVIKRGVFTLVFHPHGWIDSERIVALIDHAVEKHGKKVKFLTFQDALQRLNQNLLAGTPLRDEGGHDHGVRILDLNNDGFLDVVIANSQLRKTKIWSDQRRVWTTLGFEPGVLSWRPPTTDGRTPPPSQPLFCVLESDGRASSVELSSSLGATWHFTPAGWQRAEAIPPAGEGDRFGDPMRMQARDLNGDGRTELLYVERAATSPRRSSILRWIPDQQRWEYGRIRLPQGVQLADEQGRDTGLRFVDLNENGMLDIVFSNHQRYGIWLFEDMESGWSIEVLSGKRGEQDPDDELPPIVREDSSDNGFFVHSRHLFWQNEDTAGLPDLVARRSLDKLLKDVRVGR